MDFPKERPWRWPAGDGPSGLRPTAQAQATGPATAWPPMPVGMSLPDLISSVNVVEETRRARKPLSQVMAENLAGYDWHRIPVAVGIPHYPGLLKGVRGVKAFGVSLRLLAGRSPADSRIEDLGPLSEWQPRDYKFEQSIQVKITTSTLDNALKLVGLDGVPRPTIESKSTFTYTWQPQVQAVSANSNGGGHAAQWEFRNHGDTFLDGADYQLILLVRRKREVDHMYVVVDTGWVLYDVGLAPDIRAQGAGTVRIPVAFTASSPIEPTPAR